MTTPSRPIFTGLRDAKPMNYGDPPTLPVPPGIHRHRTLSGRTYTHGHEAHTTPHLHTRDQDRLITP